MREAVKSAARPGGVGATACRTPRRNPRSLQSYCKSSLAEVFSPPYDPPRRPAHSAGRVQKCSPAPLEIDQNFDHFLDSIFDRFWVVLGRQVGVIFGTCGAQDAPSCVQNASWKLINIKNVIFHQTHARVYRSAYLAPKMASKMPQDRPKTAPRGS